MGMQMSIQFPEVRNFTIEFAIDLGEMFPDPTAWRSDLLRSCNCLRGTALRGRRRGAANAERANHHEDKR